MQHLKRLEDLLLELYTALVSASASQNMQSVQAQFEMVYFQLAKARNEVGYISERQIAYESIVTKQSLVIQRQEKHIAQQDEVIAANERDLLYQQELIAKLEEKLGIEVKDGVLAREAAVQSSQLYFYRKCSLFDLFFNRNRIVEVLKRKKLYEQKINLILAVREGRVVCLMAESRRSALVTQEELENKRVLRIINDEMLRSDLLIGVFDDVDVIDISELQCAHVFAHVGCCSYILCGRLCERVVLDAPCVVEGVPFSVVYVMPNL